ncbi:MULTISPECIES: hypothetical protein [unclassified Microcoleus]|uniref:hypothetical protein n=1 Tax=unclassified Microcoleus TaxID=2642155 RepID=UPI002FD6EEC8
MATLLRGTERRRVGNGEHLTFAVKLEIGVLRQEARGCGAGGKRKKEGARRSVFTNMRCSLGMREIAFLTITLLKHSWQRYGRT